MVGDGPQPRGNRGEPELVTANRCQSSGIPLSGMVPDSTRADLHLGREHYEAEVERLERLGARRLWFSDDRGASCWTMADLEGNELCVD